MAHRKMILTQAGVQAYRTRMLVGDPITLSGSDARRLEKIGWVEEPKRRARKAAKPVIPTVDEVLSAEVVEEDLAALRAEYREKLGKNPFNGWDADTLREKMAEA